MRYLVSMYNRCLDEKVATMIVQLPDGYSFDEDVKEPLFAERTTYFPKLKELCKQQVPNGFHPASPFFNQSYIAKTEILAISPLPK